MIDLLDIVIAIIFMVFVLIVVGSDKWFKVSDRFYNMSIKILTVVLIIIIGTLTYSIN